MQLPQGSCMDDFRVYLHVNIIDDAGGVTSYNISTPVVVMPQVQLALDVLDSFHGNRSENPSIVELSSGNLNLVASNIMSLTSVFNQQSYMGNQCHFSISQNENFTNSLATFRGYLVEKIAALSVSDISSIKMIATSLSHATQNLNEVSASTAVHLHLFD